MKAGKCSQGCGLKFLDVAILWYGVKAMNHALALILAFLLLLSGCRNNEVEPPKLQQQTQQQQVVTPDAIGCRGCHSEIKLDPKHLLACTTCHQGIDQEGDIGKAHTGLVAKPSHPENMATSCGGCHPKQVATAAGSLHFTLANKIDTIRRHFGASASLTSPTDIPHTDTIDTALGLADDLLRRRCLRCHVYSQGDNYTDVNHGTGCAACHLAFKKGSLHSHAFIAPSERQCLSCHYGNYVGSDFHGRYEHDYHWEYRTPYTIGTPNNVIPRPYGVEYHDLAPDIHQQRGLVCTDCHRNSGHTSKTPLTCRTCHGWRPGQPAPALDNVTVHGQTLLLTGRADGIQHNIPTLRHPAHEEYGQKVACQVCHGQWSFNDSPVHLLLSKRPDYEPWERLTVQSSSEVEQLLDHNIYRSDELPMTMRDGLTGEARPGIWYQGFGLRRWEQMVVHRDTDGIIKVFRPILDLRLSMVEANGTVPFDNITGQTSGYLPYTPHTTGPAGLFYRDRFRHLLPSDPQ